MSDPEQGPPAQPAVEKPPTPLAAAYTDLPVWFRMFVLAGILAGFFYALSKGDTPSALAAMAVLGTAIGADRALRRLGNGS